MHHFSAVAATENLALKKRVFQSSTYSHETRKAAGLAVDGNTNTCTETEEETNPFWEVQLKPQPAHIAEVTVILDYTTDEEDRSMYLYIHPDWKRFLGNSVSGCVPSQGASDVHSKIVQQLTYKLTQL